MVTTTEVGQLAGECNLWLDTLRSFRHKFHQYKSIIAELAAQQSQPEVLLEIGHLDNQLYIQLINIHDVKQMVKKHMQEVIAARPLKNTSISDDTLARHEYLYDEFLRLETTLHLIGREFDRFARHMGVQ